MLQGAEFAVGGIKAGAFEFHVMLKRRRRQQFDTDVVGDHVRKVKTQLRVAAHGRFATQIGTRQWTLVHFDAGAVGFRVNRDCTGTDDDVAFSVRVSKRGNDGEGEGRYAEQRLVHGSSNWIFKIYITNGNERPAHLC